MIGKKIDIIVPVYNKMEFIESLILSFELLPKKTFNIILVDDGSKDDSYNFTKKIIKKNEIENIFLFKKNNGGVSSARNFGLNFSKSEYVWFFDPDDKYAEEIKNIFGIIDQFSADIIIFEYIVHNIKKSEIFKVGFGEGRLISNKQFMSENDALLSKNRNMSYIWNKFYKRSFIGDIRFDEKFNIGEDRIFNLDVFSKDGETQIINENIYNYYLYDSGTLSSNLNKIKLDALYETNLYHIVKCDFDRNLCKAHVLEQVILRTISGEKALFNFYIKEHKKLNISIFPFFSFLDLIMFVLTTLNLNRIFYRLKQMLK